ncbi:hypothetical protein QTP88_028711 [Uroleucon formosanum]
MDDLQNEKNYLFNIKLAKMIGLHQMLDPETVKYRGVNIYHIAMVGVFLYVIVTSVIMILSGLYYWSVNIPISMDYFCKLVFAWYVMYKMFFVIRHSNDMWNCLSITRYDFTSFGNRNRHIVYRWRERLAWLTKIYAFTYFMACFSYLAFTLAFNKDKSPVKNHDGSIGYYRQNILNLYIIVSDETYNGNYWMFYIVESFGPYFLTISLLIFDYLLITLCFSICCQMQIICSAFDSVGHKALLHHHSSIDYKVENIKISPNEHDLIYEELKTIIKDHQLVKKKNEDFFKLFRQIILLHIFVSSLMVIALCFTFIMSFSSDERFKTSKVSLQRILCLIPSILFQIFMLCYLIDNIHNQNDALIFALYSSNWTEMDMKCKKLILMTMNLNNADNKKLKFTSTKIVNLEMFFKTMGNCYTVISVLFMGGEVGGMYGMGETKTDMDGLVLKKWAGATWYICDWYGWKDVEWMPRIKKVWQLPDAFLFKNNR